MNGGDEYTVSDEEEVDDGCDEQEEFEEATESEDEPDELDYDVDIEGDESEYIDECPVDISHFDLMKKLGNGAYGTVFLVRKNCGPDIDQIYALKVITKEEVVKVPKTIIHMKAERKALELLRTCPYIQKLYYAFQTGDKLFLVTEYLPGGEMFTQVQKGPLPEDHVRFYIAELVVALEHIHMQGIVYRDIKLENVLLDADGHVKLVDFGLCKKLGARGRSKSFCGTEEYMAPEVIACTGHNTAADWWALGVLVIELLSTITPFGSNEGPDTIMNRITNQNPVMPDNISFDMEDFLTKILHKNPAERLGGSVASAIAIKQHSLFEGLDWDKLEKKQLTSPADPPTIQNRFDTQNFSEDFTQQPANYQPSAVPPNSFLTFKGYSYIAPELQQTQTPDDSIDENRNSMARHIMSYKDPNSPFHQKYKFAANQPLGTGKSSVCMKCINMQDYRHYAVKIYKLKDRNANEIDILERAAADDSLRGVVHLFEELFDSKWIYLVMELVDGVNLLEYFSTIPLNGKTIYSAVNTLWLIVEAVHALNYTHGSICFKNIYYMKDCREFRLIGFGNAKRITEPKDKRIDYWSMGACIYTILCGHSPFNLSAMDHANRIKNGKFDEDSKQWIALPTDVKTYINELIRHSHLTPTPNALTKVRKISVQWSKERLDENTYVVEKRACQIDIPLVIKKELNTETNGSDRPKPVGRTGGTKRPPDEGKPKPDGRTGKRPPHRNPHKKPKIDEAVAFSSLAGNIKAEPPNLRERKPKPSVTIIKAEPRPAPTITGRPRAPIATQPTVTHKQQPQPPNVPVTPKRSAGDAASAGISLVEATRLHWVYGWRPARPQVSFYTFERYDYKK